MENSKISKITPGKFSDHSFLIELAYFLPKKEAMSLEISLKQTQKQLAEKEKPVRKSKKSSQAISSKTGVDNTKRKKEVRIERDGKTNKSTSGVKAFALGKVSVQILERR